MDKQELILPPTFIISIDVELLWGFIRHPKKKVATLLRRDDKQCRGAIDLLLNLFQKYNIPATWATVGHLFLDHCEKHGGEPHNDLPRFKHDWYFQDPGTDIYRDPLYYGRDIVDKVLSNLVKHEIGYHSFSHVPFSQCSREVAQAEIKKGLELAQEMGIKLQSFVFPENKVGHIDVLRENGFKIYRGSNLARAKASQNLLTLNINRVIDRLVAPVARPQWTDGIWEIPSSMHFTDVPFLSPSLLPVAKRGICKAISSKAAFHIFLHDWSPLYTPSLAKSLDKLLAFVCLKREAGILQVTTLGGFASYLNEQLGNRNSL